MDRRREKNIVLYSSRVQSCKFVRAVSFVSELEGDSSSSRAQQMNLVQVLATFDVGEVM